MPKPKTKVIRMRRTTHAKLNPVVTLTPIPSHAAPSQLEATPPLVRKPTKVGP